MPTYKAKCNVDEINELIKKVKQYQESLDDKNDRFVEILADKGIAVATVCVRDADGGDPDKPIGAFSVNETKLSGLTSMTITFTGEQVLFIEFGAGINYNMGKSHPYAGKYGYGVGTYPNQKKAFNTGGWFYRKDNGDKVRTYGTEATMPMYSASQEIIQTVYETARKVFFNAN